MRLFSAVVRFGVVVPLGFLPHPCLFAQAPETVPPSIISPGKPSVVPAAASSAVPDSSGVVGKNAPFDRFKKYDQLPDLTRQMAFATQRGMAWMNRDWIHLSNGRLIPGLNPALGRATEDDHFLRQAVSAFSLARSAKLTGDEKYAVRTSQTLLSLLSETRKDTANPSVRVPTQPSAVCNRVASASYLCLAIYELPGVSPELIASAEELCGFIRAQLQPTGKITFSEDEGSSENELADLYAGPAIYALAMSNRSAQAEWKAEAVRKSISYYRKHFQTNPRMTFIPWMTAACVEAYVQTKDTAYSDFAFEMNDWLKKLQYDRLDGGKAAWRGGFPTVVEGKLAQTAPTAETAYFAMSFSECCRLIRSQTRPDAERYDSYRESAIRSLQFLSTLQYSEDNCQHFSAHFRPAVIGSFHPSATDGTVRTDQTAMCVTAFATFLLAGADQ